MDQAKTLGMDSLAITDHGNLHGAIDFFRSAVSKGVKPIIGCEMYVAPGDCHDRSPQAKTPYHLTVLAKNAQGYSNLVKLVTAANLEGFYYKPRVDRILLEQYHEGLIVLSGCPSGEVPGLIASEQMEMAEEAALWYRELFGDSYYFELMRHGGVEHLPTINDGLVRLHNDLGIPIVATNDLHYVLKEDSQSQDILVCIHTNTNIQDTRRLRMTEDSYYLKSAAEMEELFADIPEAISNTKVIADMCNIELDFDTLHLPRYDQSGGIIAEEHLGLLCREGLRNRIPNSGREEERRLAQEMEVIGKTQFANYFLVVWDITRFARESGILFTVRGSAAGSLVLYCLGVTDINPLSHKIVFERFLNVGRKQLPDIDMDFQDDRRDEVFSYVVSKYGRDRVAQIITFGTLGARASIRDVGRALAMPYSEVDSIARMVPLGPNVTLESALNDSLELASSYRSDTNVKRLLDIARNLEGAIRHSSTHAAGLVISDEPLDNYVPLQMPSKGGSGSITTTQYAMGAVEALGLLKMDILGLSNLTILAKALERISNSSEAEIKLPDIPLDDARTFEMLSNGETVGVFQLEGTGMTRYIQGLKPSSLSDLAAMIALYRPGPMEHISRFIDAKNGKIEVTYPHHALQDILEETYGVIVYQDQVLLIAQAFAGYSLNEADNVRKAMGKKIPSIMSQEREKFISGAVKQGHLESLASEVFALIEPFAGYAFAKAHSVSYGLVSYWTAYLKANHTVDYIVALLNVYTNNADKLVSAISESRRLGIPVNPPNINKSEADFSVEMGEDGMPSIRFGLAAIKNVSAGAVESMVETRKKQGGFSSIEHMCETGDMEALNSKSLESLIKVGAFDDFGSRKGQLEVVDKVLALADSESRIRESNQASLFDGLSEAESVPLAQINVPEIEMPVGERSEWEKDLLGVSFSGIGCTISLDKINEPGVTTSIDQIRPELAGNKIEIVGRVNSESKRLTRDNRPYSVVRLLLDGGEIDVFVWENRQLVTEDLWEAGALVRVFGEIRARDDMVSVSCIKARAYVAPNENGVPKDDVEGIESKKTTDASNKPPAITNGGSNDLSVPQTVMEIKNEVVTETVKFDHVDEKQLRQLTVRIRESGEVKADSQLLDDVRRLMLEFRGEEEVKLEVAIEGRIVILEWPLLGVNICDELSEGLERLLGMEGQVIIRNTAEISS